MPLHPEPQTGQLMKELLNNIYHVRVIKVPWASDVSDLVLLVSEPAHDGHHGFPVVANVFIVPPEVAGLRYCSVIGLEINIAV